MNFKKNSFLWLIFTAAFFSLPLAAAWSPRPSSSIPLDDLPTLPPEQHYSRACQYYQSKNFERAAKEFRLVANNFPTSSYSQDASFFLGVSYFQLAELDLANDAFNNYLKNQTNPSYFKEAIEYKFAIAERLKNGEKCRVLGARQLPKWGGGYTLAAEIYDEVIPAMPNHELTPRALYGKGCLLWRLKDYPGGIEAFQTLINRFPKSEYAPECFLLIARIYMEQCQREYQNPDLLALAEVNFRKFAEQFPGEERLEVAKKDLLRIKEICAKGMYDTAAFYERIGEPRAAIIYYQKVILDFPETHIATLCQSRLCTFCPQALREIQQVKRQGEEEQEDHLFDFSEIPESVETACASCSL